MKCPSCGADMKEATVCNRCGKKIGDTSQGIEVEFKDFKLSELLEIRSRHRKAPSHGSEIEKTGTHDLPDAAPETRMHPGENAEGEAAPYRPGVHEERRSAPLLIALALLLLTLLASAFLLWELLTR